MMQVVKCTTIIKKMVVTKGVVVTKKLIKPILSVTLGAILFAGCGAGDDIEDMFNDTEMVTVVYTETIPSSNSFSANYTTADELMSNTAMVKSSGESLTEEMLDTYNVTYSDTEAEITINAQIMSDKTIKLSSTSGRIYIDEVSAEEMREDSGSMHYYYMAFDERIYEIAIYVASTGSDSSSSESSSDAVGSASSESSSSSEESSNSDASSSSADWDSAPPSIPEDLF